MSRFFQQVSSDEESSEEEVPQKVDTKFAHVSSDSEEEVKRVVRSARDKRFDEITTIVKSMRNHKIIKDMANVLTDFENLTKSYDKAKKIVEAEGIPNFYVKCIAELEDFVNDQWDQRKVMNKMMAKSLGIMRQKVKKYNREFEDKIADFKENPDKYEDEPEAEETVEVTAVADEDEDVAAKPSELPSAGKAAKDAESESDSDEWMSSSSDEESSSSEDNEAYRLDPSLKFLKKSDYKVKDKDQKSRPKKPRAPKKRQEEGEEGWTAVEGREKLRVFDKGQEITNQVVVNKLNDIAANRGKRGTDRQEQIMHLAEVEAKVLENNLGLGMQAKVLFMLVEAVNDYNTVVTSNMRQDVWAKNIAFVSKLLALLEENVEHITVNINITEDAEVLDKAPYRINGCILTRIEQLDDEFTKILQNVDAHSTEYVERLKDETLVCGLIDRLCIYLEKKQVTVEDLCRAYLRKIEHAYYKFDYDWARGVELLHKEEAGDQPKLEERDIPVAESYRTMQQYCHYIYTKDSTDRIRTRAILCHIYYLANHDYWYRARDLMLMSNLQASIDHADIPTMILYNRAMVQLGLCAFRKGLIYDAHEALVVIQSSGRAKELLAQGLIPSRIERSAEQEKIERRRQVPYHMHINLELLECVYLVSAMLLEIPYMAAHEMDLRRRMISKNFHHVLKISERQTLVGPPETMREHIVAASKVMRNGDWKMTVDFIVNDKMNAKVWDLFFKSENVKSMLIGKIKEEALRTYLFTYSSVYESMSLVRLSDVFQLDQSNVHSVVSKMIINEELMASLDEPTQCLVMHKTEPSRLQFLALQLADKVNNLADMNERLADNKQNVFSSQKGGQQQQQQQSGQRRQNRYNKVNY